MTTLLDEPRPARRRQLWPMVLVIGAVALGKNACIHSFCKPEAAPVAGPVALAFGDEDLDGLRDDDEDALAAKYAPLVVLHRDDPYRPASAAWLQARTDLFHAPRPTVLAGAAPLAKAAPARALPPSTHTGSSDPTDWTTYVHVFPRADGGINIQYWFFYPYSNGPLFFDHDSDWEHATVQLDSSGAPVGVHVAQHENDHPGRFHPWAELQQIDGHIVLYSAKGTHATFADPKHVAWFEGAAACADPERCAALQWRTWEAGGLENVGERGRPMQMNSALWFRDRWGGTGFMPGTSAPYGPLFHRGFCVDGVRHCLDEVGERTPGRRQAFRAAAATERSRAALNP